MIVTRAKAEEAAGVLLLDLNDNVQDYNVVAAYRYLARKAHPDMPGGNVEAFARVDWAKQVLLAWLARDTSVVQLRKEDCTNCLGTGRVKIMHGFKTMQVLCGMCKGSGDAQLDKEKEECDD